ncbi:GAF domain-containing protein [Soehngenia saccharolytica]|nr:GAF domain-containing protein [Soehngenia saccharolytica]
MIKIDSINKMTEVERLKYMNLLLKGQLSSETDVLANISNSTAIIKLCINNINWSGFYFLRGSELVLGPFQGLPACNRIKIGKGVCGTSVERKEPIIVDNVNEFEGHIACDENSRSEIVIPIIQNDEVFGVLDIDSPYFNRFDEIHLKYLTEFVSIMNKYIKWNEFIN